MEKVPRCSFLLSVKYLLDNLPLSTLKYCPWSIYGSLHVDSVCMGTKLIQQTQVTAKSQASIAKGCGMKEPWYDHDEFTVSCSGSLLAELVDDKCFSLIK
ncbi:hypothetical protein [Aliivibrio fischeri]|uniref:hypothetical protein n=1 Tax=Aliivibrio fischeri TaxID=668 RepID=UPI001F1B524F|nr:hypothetical protein [Aliivibrio fischeri]MCE7556583.1 hypothetical protein [Aliivibrio fischeri]MCE7564006.1 hypothetical protein [Aliivibrio fischeri]MCE7571480.1 hypothetical protein [Aliivibrio fischeri]